MPFSCLKLMLSSVREMYTQALMRGCVKVSYGRVMLLGLAAAGKTSLMHGLMNEPLPDKAESTILADSHYYWVKTDQNNQSCWMKTTVEDEITEEARAAFSATEEMHHASLPKLNLCSATALVGSSISATLTQRHRSDVLDKMRDFSQLGVDTKKEVLLHIWDCGGQPVFLSVLPAFLSSRTVFLLVFDASINLNDPCRVIVNNHGEQQVLETLEISGLHLLQRWMASIHARFARAGKSGNLPRYPRIVLIGTHADKLGQSERERQKAAQHILNNITSTIKGKEYSNMLMDGECMVHVVDNTTAGMGQSEDKKIKKLRDKIHEFVQDKLCIHTPVSWVQFRKVLQLHVKKVHPVLSLDEVKKYAKESAVPAKEFFSALMFYHELGVLLFFPMVHGLESVVILEPQWLVDCFGALLSKWKSRADHRYMWNILGNYGILIESLYNEVLEPILLGSRVSPQSIVEMLQHFLLAAPITTAGLHGESGRKKEYFVPLMLEHRLTTSTTKEPSTDSPPSSTVKRAATLYVVFRDGYIPPGFYVRMVTCLSTREGVVILFEAGIYSNQVTMRIGDVDMLIITEHIDSVELVFFRTVNVIKSFRNSCREVGLMLNDCFSLISKWLPGVVPNLAFFCPKCESAQVSHSQAHFCTFSVQHRASDVLHCKGVHSFFPSHSQRYWLLPDDVSHIEQAMEERQHQSSEFTRYLTSAIGDKMADVAKELEMSLSDDLLEQFYDNGGDDIELAQCLRAVRMRALANKLVLGQLHVAEGFNSVAPIVTEAETWRSDEEHGEPISVVLLVDAVKNVNDWHNLGLHLYLEEAKLEEIGITYHVYGVIRMKTEMFKVWLKSCPDASWHKLVTALNAIDEKRVAKEVESRRCKQLPDSHRATTVSSDASASYAVTSYHCLDGQEDEVAMATRHEDTDIHGQQPAVADGGEGRTIQGSIEDHNLRSQTVAAENLHPHDVPHLPGHEAGQQSISEPDQDKKDNSSANPKPKRPASQYTTLVHCIMLSLCIYAVVQLLVLISSVLDFLSS